MCTQQEVREVIRSENPPWARAALIAGFAGLFGWQLLATHNQGKGLESVGSSILVSNAQITGQIQLLSTEIKNIKEVSIDRSRDRYTATEARARNALIDERCKQMTKRVDHLHDEIGRHHNVHE